MTAAALCLAAACGDGTAPGPAAVKSTAAARAARRAYDGAPPVIPHAPFQMTCTECHNARGIAVPGVGFAPPAPHGATPGLSLESRCVQCHVFRSTDAVLVESDFAGLAAAATRGERLYDGAPPTVPHAHFLREDCLACHAGAAAREEIRCSHPERARCVQCHTHRDRWTGEIEEFQR